MEMGFEDFFQKHQHTTFCLKLILVHALFITLSYSQKNCRGVGDFACHETNLNLYYQCLGHGKGIVRNCNGKLHFDPKMKSCNWPNPTDCRIHINHSKTTKINGGGAVTKPPTKPVVTTSRVPFKRSSLLSKVLSTTTSKPPTRPQIKPELTGPCRPKHCKLPNCKCPGPEIPGSLPTNSTPQIVLLTFDDGVDMVNLKYYRRLFTPNLRNPNGCPIQATFFVSGDYTNYGCVKELYQHGHEIASHSKTHRLPTTFWLNASLAEYIDEIVGMKQLLCERANIPKNDIRGMRSPFLAMGEDNQFKTLEFYNFSYDSSMVTGSPTTFAEKPTWPFTLDYPVNNKYCSLTYCPKKSYPGLWEVPLIRWHSNKIACAMPDACRVTKDENAVLKFLHNNFARHYTQNKAPFGIFLHSPWLMDNLKPLKQFLEEISLMNDVWIVTVSQALEWIQNPVSLSNISQFKSWQCK